MGVSAWSSRSAQSVRQALGVKPGALHSFIYSPEINNHYHPAADMLFMLPTTASGKLLPGANTWDFNTHWSLFLHYSFSQVTRAGPA